MPVSDGYPVPAARHRAEQTIDRSRFICTIDRASTAEAGQALIRACSTEFPDATHHCWAYVAGPPGDTNRVGMSDAGEPHGTAGRPMLTVLLHAGVGEIAAVVTRYYGGTKLGTGGLVKAYGGSVQLALESLQVVERIDYARLDIAFAYPHIAAVQQVLPRFKAETDEQTYDVDVRYALRVPRAQIDALCAALADATSGTLVASLAPARGEP